jgi:nucleoside-diphosphate kinase
MKTIVQYIKESLSEVNGFAILKPDFLEHEYDFDNLLKNKNWQIVQKVKRTLSIDEAKELYIGLKDKPFYDELCTYMASGDSISYMLRKDCKDPIKDLKTIKNKVRKEWGKDEMRNAMHSSDSKENVEREYKLILQKQLV